MSITGHRPIRSCDTAPPSCGAQEIEVLEAAGPRPTNAVVLPYYRPPCARLRRRDASLLEALAPDIAPDPGPVRDAAEGSFGANVLFEAVIGNDDRVRVADPLMRNNPWRQICALHIFARSGTPYVGTGWFIAPGVLATAGHCVYLHKDGGWAQAIDVIPAKNGSSEPFGRGRATRFAAVDGWLESAFRDFDYGVIYLDDLAIGAQIGNFEVEAAADVELSGVIARISGYPADRDRAEYQYYHERPLQRVTPTRLLYDIDTFGGQSGSPIWRQTEGGPAVAIGIHTTGGLTSNSGTRISDAVLDNLIRWIEKE